MCSPNRSFGFVHSNRIGKAYVAWWSTIISDQRQFRTVLLVDRRRRARSIITARIPFRQLSNHIETLTIASVTPVNTGDSLPRDPTSANSSITAEEEHSSQPPTAEPVQDPLQAASSSSQLQRADEHKQDASRPALHDSEENDIIETMDADAQNDLRQRRIAHFEGNVPSNADQVAQSIPNRGCEANNKDSQSSDIEKKDIVQPTGNNKSSDTITIKLKYINDDIKTVDGRLEEPLGDFKRRHFEEEMHSNKEIKLIFNGHVLKQDRHTLKCCGLFDNCVVHCLVHQKRPSNNNSMQSEENLDDITPPFLMTDPLPHIINGNNNNQGIDWDLGNALFAIVSFVLLAAWYFRYVYAQLYTVTATVGLIIVTGVFTIVLVGAYLPNDEYDTPDTNLRIRLTRTERVEVQQ
ncbi:transmembrane and ubiquitin-like domain-containing protein 1 isoform X2 [Dendroctonus ponderosae]|uniref:transmembrane and ubiquitin-like domain-containing protein 1 isoform X2 n=1 Tax=Dendroctonus ponderosae TaxID=77166 RepID=UPI002035FD31|nr:transmembrane and ubiquitin-like domain-containing protein 1 isoform X2 [Dendroctonus ponderosae]